MSSVAGGLSPVMMDWYQPRQMKATQVMKLRREVREEATTAVCPLVPLLPRKTNFNMRLG